MTGQTFRTLPVLPTDWKPQVIDVAFLPEGGELFCFVDAPEPIRISRNAAEILDRTDVPTRDRLYFDGEIITKLNSDRQAEKKKAIAKLPKRVKRRIRGTERKRKNDLLFFEAQRLWIDGFPSWVGSSPSYTRYIED